MQKSAAFLMVIVLLCGLLLMSESRRDPVAGFESAYSDWIAANASRSVPLAHVTLVEINDGSLSGEHAWPWSPLEYTLFLKTALPFKPDVVAIEPVLGWQGAPPAGVTAQNMQQYRRSLHDYILQSPKLILGAQLGVPDDTSVVPPKQPAPLLRNVKGDLRAIPVFNDLPMQADEDYRVLAPSGFTNMPDQGRITRKYPLVFNYRGEIVPSLVLQSLIQWYKLTPDDVIVEPGVAITLGKAAVIPIDVFGRVDLDFNSIFTRFGHDDLLLAVSDSQDKHSAAVSTAAIGGGILLLARTDSAARTLLVPSGEKKSAGELAAVAIATVQNKSFSRRITHTFDFAVIAFMMALSCFFHRFTKGGFLLLSLVALLGYLLLSFWLYSHTLVWLPFALPVSLLLLVNFFSLFIARTLPVVAGKPDAVS